MSLSQSIRKNTLWIIGGDMGSRVLELAFGIVMARLLLPEDFGLIVTAQIVTGALGYFAAGGMSDALIRAPSVTKRDRDTVFTAQLIIAVPIFALIVWLAPAIAALFREPRVGPVLQVSAIGFLLRPFMFVPLAILQRQMRFRESSILLFVTIVVTGFAGVALALLGFGVWSLLFGGFIGSAVRIAILVRIANWIPAIVLDLDSARRLGAFGIRVSAIDLIQYARQQGVNGVVSRTLGVAGAGLFNKADSLSEVPFQVLSMSAYQTMFRALSTLQDDLDQSAYLFLRSITLVSFYALPCFIGLAWVAEPFVVTLFGDNWAPVAVPLQVLCVAGMFRVVINLSSAVTAAQDRLRQEIPIQLQMLVLTVVGALIGTRWGIVGTAVGTLPGFVIGAALMYRLASGALGVGWTGLARALAPVLWLNGVLFAALALTHLILDALALTGSDLVYLAVMVVSGTAVYGALTLLCAPPSLRGESERWRDYIALAMRGVRVERRRRPPGVG